MGYGFTHFRNSADVCNLAVSPDLKERIKTIEAHKRSLMTVVRPDVDLEKDPSFQKSLMVHSNQATHWVRLKYSDIRLRHHPRSPTYEFSRHFLEECSLAFSNKREVAKADFSFQFCEDFLDSSLSRNKLHVMCSVTMMLQRQLAAIAKHDEDLPQWPQNDRQFHAARYRRNQLRILSSVVNSLIGELRMIKGVGSPTAGNIRAVRLEYILLDSPQGLLTDFRSVLNAILGTRNPYKIRKHGWVECAFTVWLCGLFLWDLRNGPIGFACSEFSANILKWLKFLRRVYGEPFIVNTSQQKLMELHGQNKNDELTIKNPETNLYDDDIDERLSLVQSYLAAIITAVKKNPISLFGDSEVTIPYLMWCLNVVREEGVMCPNLEGKVDEENDEFILYMDNDEEG